AGTSLDNVQVTMPSPVFDGFKIVNALVEPSHPLSVILITVPAGISTKLTMRTSFVSAFHPTTVKSHGLSVWAFIPVKHSNKETEKRTVTFFRKGRCLFIT